METPNLDRSDCLILGVGGKQLNAEVAAIHQDQRYRSSAAE